MARIGGKGMKLTEREKKIISLVAEHKSSREIFFLTGYSPRSVDNCMTTLNRFYQCKNRFDLAKKLMNKIKLEEINK